MQSVLGQYVRMLKLNCKQAGGKVSHSGRRSMNRTRSQPRARSTFNRANATTTTAATSDPLTRGTTLQPSLPLQMLLQLPEEQLYSHGVPDPRSSGLGQPRLSH